MAAARARARRRPAAPVSVRRVRRRGLRRRAVPGPRAARPAERDDGDGRGARGLRRLRRQAPVGGLRAAVSALRRFRGPRGPAPKRAAPLPPASRSRTAAGSPRRNAARARSGPPRCARAVVMETPRVPPRPSAPTRLRRHGERRGERRGVLPGAGGAAGGAGRRVRGARGRLARRGLLRGRRGLRRGAAARAADHAAAASEVRAAPAAARFAGGAARRRGGGARPSPVGVVFLRAGWVFSVGRAGFNAPGTPPRPRTPRHGSRRPPDVSRAGPAAGLFCNLYARLFPRPALLTRSAPTRAAPGSLPFAGRRSFHDARRAPPGAPRTREAPPAPDAQTPPG